MNRQWEWMSERWNELDANTVWRLGWLGVSGVLFAIAAGLQWLPLVWLAGLVWIPSAVKAGTRRRRWERVLSIVLDVVVALLFGILFAYSLSGGLPDTIPAPAIIATVVVFMVETVSTVTSQLDEIHEAKDILERYEESIETAYEAVTEARFAELSAKVLSLERSVIPKQAAEKERLASSAIEVTHALRAWLKQVGALVRGSDKNSGGSSGWLGLMSVYQREEKIGRAHV